jgi:hypothetical protein
MPKSGYTTSSYTATATSSNGYFSGLNAYTITCDSGIVSGTCSYNSTDPVFVKKADGYWYHRTISDTYSIVDYQLTTSFPSSVPLTFTNPGEYDITGTFFDNSGGSSTATDSIEVLSSGESKTLTIQVKDLSSGSFVSEAIVSVVDPFGNWTNRSAPSGTLTYKTQAGEIVGYGATKSGYYDSSIVYVKIVNDLTKTILLKPLISVPEGNNTLYVYVKDKDTLSGLSDATVWISDGQTRKTGSSGVATFTVLEGGSYSITVTKTGYQSLTGSITVAGTGNAISMELSRLTVTTSPTLAPGASPTVDTRTDSQKDAAMMGKVRASGDDLIGLAIIAAMFGLIGLIGKSMK